ncbi:crossover junction endodeoxyribonuclease RuvC [candidate division WWE3 bacterium RIFOXYC1_FULL_39_7]|uniref:Crossover junction endodeoxyribonuclease RuvC n=2 Tax=Katanobacteria TaxID=422282 RepID=A0A1F4X3C1_UNCKA|nr:MAG: crossover junction endodeoxyribonuclease RuvC [candidate division WWE3 bacterium RIFOXYC1_FULL_39_7]OGC76200.1 MAG: crossover junction endodeoxyribonuclease RuvC [candidate division WWE3 bacterium RIFOXYD1_FULL_39_9]
MRIIGIDPGTARMGYSIMDVVSEPKIVKTDVIITPAGEDMHKRLNMLYDSLHAILTEHTPEIMVIEKLFFNTNVKTAITVGQARGVAMLTAAQNGLSVYEYTALEAKRLLTGYGRSSKKEMQEAVKLSLKLENLVKSDDANDAVAIALCFIMKDLPALTK